MASWLIGNVGRVSLEAVDIDGVPIDPTNLRVKVKSPSGVVTTYAYPGAPEIVRTSDGNFYADIPFVEDGDYTIRYESDPPVMGAGQVVVNIRPSGLA